MLLLLAGAAAVADPYPPTLANGAAHFPPVDWPSEPANAADCGQQCGQWQPYTRFQSGVADPRVQDPSNGGTAPQNYVNIASSCIDKKAPSVYYALRQGAAADGSQDVIMFRWRVEQIANTYATGPCAGSYGASDPWSSALWSVLFDVDGDGYLDLAAHLDGSSGSPSMAIDRIAGIWSRRPTQSLDYLGDPTNVHLLAHNPTAFVDPGTSRLLNFGNRIGGVPQPVWPNGSAETTWDYGTTRAKRVSSSPCNEFFIDYQIPVQMLDASALGGPKITRSTPISMVFCTANSLNNPFQKDCAINARWTGEAARPAPFGDYVSFNQADPYAQPIVSKVVATPPSTCPGSYTLTATVQDTLAVVNGVVVPSVQAVRFFYYHDANGNGLADDGGSWTFAVDGALRAGSFNTWSASWSGVGLPKGAYLIGVQALDDNTKVDLGVTPSGLNNRTFSYVAGDAQNRIYVDGSSYAAVPAHAPAMTPGPSENWWGNPSVTGNQVALVGLALNSCGVAPTLAKTANTTNLAVGGQLDYTFTLTNTLDQALTVDRIDDSLPAGFSVVGTTPGSLVPTTSPAPGATGTVGWTFSPPVTLAAGASAGFSFRAQAGSVAGNYNNTATASTSFGSLASAPVPVAVDGARLSLSKTPNTYQATANGSTPLVYTLRYANDSTVAVDNARIVDTLPAGVTYGSCTGGCVVSGNQVTWTLGTLGGGATGAVQLTVTVNNGYPTANLTNSATLDGTDPSGNPVSQSASATVSVPVSGTPAPAFALSKTTSAAQVAPGANVVWTLSYSNYGTAPASGVTISDPLPAGFTYVSSTGGGVLSGGAITWNIGNVPAAGSGSVTVTARADTPFTAFNPATNTASLNWSGNPGSAVVASVQTGVTGQSCSKYYFRNTALNVGAGAGTQLIATQSATDPTGAGAVKAVNVPASAVADTLPAGLTATGIAGSGWSCTLAPLACSRSDVLGAGAAYPAITLTVAVAANAAPLVTNQATVSGGGETDTSNSAATDPTTITALALLPDLTLAKTHTGAFSQGQSGAQYQLVVTNVGAGPSAGTVSVADTLPAGLTATALAGTGWTCTLAPLACERADALAAGASYPAIALTVDVAANAPAQVTNQATVSGGSEANAANNTASDPTTITAVALAPDLQLSKTHAGNFTQGQAGAVYTLTVRNTGAGPTTGTATVVDTLPAGLTATALGGTGWTCVLATLSCTRSDALVAGSSWPAIALTVTVAANAPAQVTNEAAVSGGGDATPGNNTASDPTTVVAAGPAAAAPIPVLAPWAWAGLTLLLGACGWRARRPRR